MEESNVIKGTSVIIFGGEMLSLFWDLRWMIMLAVILVAVDFRFGVKAAQARGEKIRNSKAGRRTANKLIDYICYLVLGGLIGKAIGEPLGVNPTLVAAVCMSVACLFEVDSILQNICEYKGVKYSFSLWKVIIALVKSKQKDIGDAIEEGVRKEESK